MHSKEKIFDILKKKDVLFVSTLAGKSIKSRMMHFYANDDFSIYVASMKNDPKIHQILINSNISMLIHVEEKELGDSKEIEISGNASLVEDEKEREIALKALSTKSPVVKYLVDSGNSGLLHCLKIIPFSIKYRIFKEIVQGTPPTVIEFPENISISDDWKKFKSKLKVWFTELRAPFLTASVIPVLLGTSIAWYHLKKIDFISFILTLLGGVFLHLGCNIVNDYFDHKSLNDDINREFVRPFSGGSRMIQLGLLSPLEVFSGGMFFFILGSGIGIYLTIVKGWQILALGLVGVISSFFYVAPPFNWASRGFGELLVGLNFGTLITLGAYFVQAQKFSTEALIASLPVALLIAGVLYINEFPDYNADKAVGKNTLVVRLGRKNAAKLYIAIISLTYIIVLIFSLFGKIPLASIIALSTIPLGIKTIQYAIKYHSSPIDLIPANAMTILSHMFTGILLGLSFLFYNNLYLSVSFLILFFFLIFYYIRKIEKRSKVMKGVQQTVS
ncbi:MAG: 1,4-dihydroxy-2-naphthoate octaprenyltransferase [Acidobacteriota bacterium]